jgi:hypothetical protein
MISIVTDDEELWGQFADIEHGYSFQEQKVVYFSNPKTNTSPKPIPKPIQIPLPKTTPILIPVVLPSVLPSVFNGKTMVPYRTEPSYKNKNDDYCNPAFNKIIERQIYLGCIICILTVGLFILP